MRTEQVDSSGPVSGCGADERVLAAADRVEVTFNLLAEAAKARGVSPADIPNGMQDLSKLVDHVREARELAVAAYFATRPVDAAVFEHSLDYAASTLRLARTLLEATRPGPSAGMVA